MKMEQLEAIKDTAVKKVITSTEIITPVLSAMLEEDMSVTITVTGNSMFPLWRHKRDSVTLNRCNKSALKIGDIPLYRRASGKYVLHRIVGVNENSYNLCGDNQTQIEYNLPKEDIVAVVSSFTRKGRKYSCGSLGYSLYWRMWIWLLPARRIIRLFK